MGYNQEYIKEKVASNYKIATFIFTTFLATMAGVVALYQKGDLGVLFVAGLLVAFAFLVPLAYLLWFNNKLVEKLNSDGNKHN